MNNQEVKYDLLEAKKTNVDACFIDIINLLEKIEGNYKKIIDGDMWVGPKSEAFITSLTDYWKKNESGIGIVERIEEEKTTLAAFIQSALDSTKATDEDSSKQIGGVQI